MFSIWLSNEGKKHEFNLSLNYYYYLNDQLLKIKLYLLILANKGGLLFKLKHARNVVIKTWKKCCDQNMEEML